MGYAIRNDGLGWRAVDSADDCFADESFSEIPPARPEPSNAEVLINKFNLVKYALQAEIDRRAILLGFSNGNSLMLYAGFTNAFQVLAQQFASWEASVWVEAGTYRDEVIAGNQPLVTPEEAVAMMPAYPI